jgi:hypothetical protein
MENPVIARFAGAITIIASLSVAGTASARPPVGLHCKNPSPKTILGICNKQAGGVCRGKRWYINTWSDSTVARRNKCIDDMTLGKTRL